MLLSDQPHSFPKDCKFGSDGNKIAYRVKCRLLGEMSQQLGAFIGRIGRLRIVDGTETNFLDFLRLPGVFHIFHHKKVPLLFSGSPNSTRRECQQGAGHKFG